MEVDDPMSEMSLDCSTERMPQRVHLEISQTSTSSKIAPVSTKQAETSPKAGADASGDKFGVEKVGRTQLVAGAPDASDQSEIYRTNDTCTSKQASSQQPATNTVPLLNTVMQEEVSSSSATKNSTPGPISLKPLASVLPGSTASSSSFSSSSTVINPSQPQTTESDPNNIVALKIIISDEQEQQGGDSALNQAVSSISGDCIPTIFLSPPAKSLTKVHPSTPGSSITPEETAQAVSSLQGAECVRDPVISAQNQLQPAQARPVAPETGFIQLVPANPTFGAPSRYFVVKDPSSGVEQHSSMMMLPGAAGEGAVCPTPQVVATPPRPRAVVSVAPNVARPFSPGKSKN